MDLVDQLVLEALKAAEALDGCGPALLSDRAEELRPGNGWHLIAEARDLMRARVLRDPGDLAHVVGLGLLTVALAVRGEADRAPAQRPRPSTADARWGRRLRATAEERGWDTATLAATAGVTPAQLLGLERRSSPPTEPESCLAAVAVLEVLAEDPAEWLDVDIDADGVAGALAYG